MKFKFITLIILLACLSCTKKVGLKPGSVTTTGSTTSSTAGTTTGATTGGPTDTCVTHSKYGHDISVIIAKTCALPTCHVASGFKDFSTYAAFKAELDSYTAAAVLARIKAGGAGGGMPPTYTAGPTTLSVCDQTKIETWFNANYPNN